MLALDELAVRPDPHAELDRLADLRIEEAVAAAVEQEAVDGVLEDVGYERVGRPPVTSSAVCSTRLFDGAAVLTEHVVVGGQDDRRRGVDSPHLGELRHYVWPIARAGVWATSAPVRGRVQAASSSKMPSGSWK